ncbi:MAG: EAL domain-containing protein, partial [Gammaproteobacteria bacterium]
QSSPAPKPLPASAEFNFGLRVLYEPEFFLRQNEGNPVKRVRVHYTWRKDDGKLLSNGPFLLWAEEIGVSKGIFNAVIKLSLETLRVWSNQEFCPELAVRLDSALLSELDLPDFLADLVDMNHVSRELLIIEINESAIRNGKDIVWDVISRMSIKGFRLAVFAEGNGENALSFLDKLAIDQLIVDMTALPDKANLKDDMELEFAYSSLASMAEKKGISICAGNVRSSEELEFVRRCNFRSARGSQIYSADSAQNVFGLYKEGKFS